MPDKEVPIKNILISNMNKIGIVHLHGIERYLKRADIQKTFLVTPNTPHENVFNHAKHIPSLEIVVSSNFSEERKKIAEKYSEAKIVIVDPYHLAGRDGMLDAWKE